jgi:hypothetical protein
MYMYPEVNAPGRQDIRGYCCDVLPDDSFLQKMRDDVVLMYNTFSPTRL